GKNPRRSAMQSRKFVAACEDCFQAKVDRPLRRTMLKGMCGEAASSLNLEQGTARSTCRSEAGREVPHLPCYPFNPRSSTLKENAGHQRGVVVRHLVDVYQQRLNCALPSFSLSFDALSRCKVFTAYPVVSIDFFCSARRG